MQWKVLLEITMATQQMTFSIAVENQWQTPENSVWPGGTYKFVFKHYDILFMSFWAFESDLTIVLLIKILVTIGGTEFNFIETSELITPSL